MERLLRACTDHHSELPWCKWRQLRMVAAARAVRAVRGFHLDDVGAEFAEDARREWARDERAQLQDFQPCQSRHGLSSSGG